MIWPFKDITPTDITRFASNGEWEKVKKAADMAVTAGRQGIFEKANNGQLTLAKAVSIFEKNGHPLPTSHTELVEELGDDFVGMTDQDLFNDLVGSRDWSYAGAPAGSGGFWSDLMDGMPEPAYRKFIAEIGKYLKSLP